MSEPVWYRSLYWRIALGFIACVAAVLVLQGALLLWLASREGGPLDRSPRQIAAIVASDLSLALEQEPGLDISRYVENELGRDPHRVLVLLADGGVVRNRDFDVPDGMMRALRARAERLERRQRVLGGLPSAGERPQGFEPEARGDEPGGRGMFARMPTSVITADGRTIGWVTVFPPGPPQLLAFRTYGGLVGSIGLGLLAIGTAVMAFFVFRPSHRRLLALQHAVEMVGAGHASVRADEAGGDEVAGLARAFNRMASELEARVEQLEEGDQMRRQLLADVSHELMTPLTAIRGYLETLSIPRAVPDEATRERYLAIVSDETERLASMIGDLLDLARLEGGGITMSRETVSIEALFQRAAERHGTALHDKGITIATHVAPDAETVLGDERRLEQAIQNLVANAVRHTPRGGRITLSSCRDEALHIGVEDTGPGIPPEHLPRIFDRFYRVDVARDQASGGTGLGLSIVRAIVQAHGGTVRAENVPGGGARFTLSFRPPPAPLR